MLDADGAFSKADTLALATTSLEALIGIDADPEDGDLVATRGGELLGFDGKVVAVISPRRGLVDVM